jgi:anti-sigma B factor antagonist
LTDGPQPAYGRRVRPPLAMIEDGSEGSPHVVSIRGELDVADVPRLRDWLTSASAAGRRPVIVDLRSVTFMAVSAVYVLCDEQERMADHGARLTVVCTRPSIRRMLSMCHTDGVLHVVDQRPTAHPPWSDEDRGRATRLRAWLDRYERGERTPEHPGA